MFATWALIDSCAALLLIYVIRGVLLVSGKPSRPPPGPPGWPIIGNVFDMPTSYQWETFAAWGDRWGDIVSISLFGKRMVILNSLDVANELLDRKGAIYSDRPVLPVSGEIVNLARFTGFQQYGPVLKNMRRLVSQTVGTNKSLTQLTGALEDLVQDFVRRVASDPLSLSRHVQRLTATSGLRTTYGYDVEKDDDELIKILNAGMERFNAAALPGAFLADMVPFFNYIPSWFPGVWKQTAQAWRRDIDAMADVPFDITKSRVVRNAGTAAPSMVALNMTPKTDPQTEKLVKDAAASMYSGGAITASAVRTFYLAMMCYPEVQRKAQAEIDRVVGTDRLPSIADREQLPYIRALCWEVLRWQTNVPVGLPHCSAQDDVHAGYFIPKGTVIIANIWRMHRDPQRYHCPERFNPDRYLPRDGNDPETDPRQMVFGFGRRSSFKGAQLAEATLFLVCAMSLAAFDVIKPNVNGVVVEPSMEYTSGIVRHPVEFQCSIKPRSPKVEVLLSLSHASST
ncbi:hypothetical protein FOMPIDRAFT_1125292 [Fomitopsis schrenkii]|uniref:Cytochrome P450 n=1 Tax=Fomitopsis schrenkii TaxID=2126942 RepID=S8FKX3_FOMSC|nr:hypothetical protein FOMPIDRAFT_1125292 [Fomitopsis schrenkii]